MWKEQKDSGLTPVSLASTVHDDCEKRMHLVEIAAYFIAEKRGFAPNHALEDWLEAERETERHLDSFSS